MRVTEDRTIPQLDIAEPQTPVEISMRKGVLHVNIEGVCVLRICRIREFSCDITGHEPWTSEFK